MNQIIIIICLILMVIMALAVMMQRSMIKSAIALAIISGLLSIILFNSDAYWAALFELSVCAGLITVVLISTISITSQDRRNQEHRHDHHRRFAALPFILIIAGIGLLSILIFGDFNVELAAIDSSDTSFDAFREVLWHERQVDIFAQIILILGGAFAVTVLFKEFKGGEKK